MGIHVQGGGHRLTSEGGTGSTCSCGDDGVFRIWQTGGQAGSWFKEASPRSQGPKQVVE